jgi:predicted HicB family RNase H-like nuclease
MSDVAQQLPLDPVTQEPLPDLAAMRPEEKTHEVYQRALAVYGRSKEWVTFFRDVVGLEGVIRKFFPKEEERAAFERTTEFAEIKKMLKTLRERSNNPNETSEATHVITVRLPKSLHEALKNEAHQRQTSMNQLCISKLLQMIEE